MRLYKENNINYLCEENNIKSCVFCNGDLLSKSCCLYEFKIIISEIEEHLINATFKEWITYYYNERFYYSLYYFENAVNIYYPQYTKIINAIKLLA